MKELNVFYHHKLVGTLAQKDKKTYFEYDSEFLRSNIQLSPFVLPLQKKLFEHTDYEFGELFGLFDDSLPDGWGMLLMHRYLTQLGIDVKTLSKFDLLSYIGNNGMGALHYEPQINNKVENKKLIELKELGHISTKIYHGEKINVLKQVLLIGGSPHGARPKATIIRKNSGEYSTDIYNIEESDEYWLVKFNVSSDFKQFSKIEYIYSLLAKKCGLEMTETDFSHQHDLKFFAIKRFDREQNRRVHMHSLSGLIQSNFRVPNCDYETLFKVTQMLTKSEYEMEKAFRLMVFNIVFHNRDDHTKNFSYLFDQEKGWTLSPCFDLTPSWGPGGEHSMTINGKGDKILYEDIEALGLKMGLHKMKITQIVEAIMDTSSLFEKLAIEYDLHKSDMQKILKMIQKV